ncbi:hypothetical protein [Sporomusa sphaeroides]|uniref:Chromosome partition protein Smc n=1 Tax=Sporomusa sphaeroides DSM 2875 TaxID=1337886 RepID=A0ABM9W1Q7_9FIRM|nr:hypothetical protein [Sporomusa sphaeroides]OLS56820.1 hypothetical protein SPSPH_03100 [Sporomusa sphaeroides DSM 2875]CVK18767.1 hypothetical protein SSPH_01411 [Sporomusa sphaeroides DSM 2875]
MEELLNQILDGQKQITQRLDKMDARLDRIESDMASERQQIEISQIVHALKHNSEEVNAQLHSLGHNLNVLTGEITSVKETTSLLDSKFDVLNNRLFQQEAELNRYIRAVK